MRRPQFLDRLDGAPFSLPYGLDRVSERWWRIPPRRRFLLLAAAAVVILLVAVSHAAGTPYGPPVPVLIASQDLDVGQEIEPGDLNRTTWPEGLIPDGAADEAAGRLAAPVPAGTVLTDRHLAVGGIAERLPHGTVAVPVPVDAVPALDSGSRIDLIGRDLHGGAAVLAREAYVLSTDVTGLWLAVARDDAPQVAAAAASDSLTVVLLAP